MEEAVELNKGVAEKSQEDPKAKDTSSIQVVEKRDEDPEPEPITRRKALLMWSGGFDSTLLLAALTKYDPNVVQMESFARGYNGVTCGTSMGGPIAYEQLTGYRTVRVATIYCSQFSRAQMERQIIARGRVLGLIEEKIGRQIEVVRINADYDGAADKHGGLFQQQASVYYGTSILERDEDLIVGWHFADHANAYMERLYRLFNDHAGMTHRTNSRLLTPLIMHQKEEILRYIHDLGLWNACTTCEGWGSNAFNHNCGRCQPCRNILKSIFFGERLDRETRKNFLSTFDPKVVQEHIEYCQGSPEDVKKSDACEKALDPSD